MKYNKFLILLTVYIGISANISVVALQTPNLATSAAENAFTNLLKENNYTVDFIKELQIIHKDNEHLNTALLKHYIEEYSHQINTLPYKNNQSITNLINQKKKECTSFPESIEESKKEPMIMEELGTNKGHWGLRMQALNFLEKELNEGKLQLTQ